jgi:monoamine oxidase
VWEATDVQSGRPGILLGYTMGRAGEAFTALSDRERIAEAAREINVVYPRSQAQLRRSATAAWAKERYTGGTYTAYAPGQVTSFWRALRRPHERVYFAGEHTDEYTAYMEGAVRSGRRAAERIDSAA